MIYNKWLAVAFLSLTSWTALFSNSDSYYSYFSNFFVSPESRNTKSDITLEIINRHPHYPKQALTTFATGLCISTLPNFSYFYSTDRFRKYLYQGIAVVILLRFCTNLRKHMSIATNLYFKYKELGNSEQCATIRLFIISKQLTYLWYKGLVIGFLINLTASTTYTASEFIYNGNAWLGKFGKDVERWFGDEPS